MASKTEGWLAVGGEFVSYSVHEPLDPTARTGHALLFVRGLGHEDASVESGLHEIGRWAAARGVVVGIVGRPGTNHSTAGAGVAVTEGWQSAAAAAAHDLRGRGARCVIVAGIRMGALIALSAAPRMHADGVVLWVPPPSGKRGVRAARLLQAASLHEAVAPPGGVAVAGYRYDAATVDALNRLELDVPLRSNLDVLLIEDAASRVGEHIVAALERDCRSLERLDSADTRRWVEYVEDLANVPEETAEQLIRWVLSRPLPEASVVGTTNLTSVAEFEVDGTMVQESVVSVGSRGLSAIVTQRSAGRLRHALVLLSSLGPGGMFVEVARAAAREGYTVLRADLSGFGSNPAPNGHQLGEVYTDESVDDVREIVEFIAASGSSTIKLVGFCAGGWSALGAAGSPGLTEIVAINVELFESGSRASAERHSLRRLAQRILRRPSIARRLAVLPGRQSASPTLGWLREAVQAGQQVRLVYDKSDEGLRYWNNEMSRHFTPTQGIGRIDLAVHDDLGHMLEGADASAVLDAVWSTTKIDDSDWTVTLLRPAAAKDVAGSLPGGAEGPGERSPIDLAVGSTGEFTDPDDTRRHGVHG